MIRDLVVELVTPTAIGGSEPRQCDDPPVLRPPSLRGQLRFWTRALSGGGSNGEAQATRLWGDTDTGQRIRVLGSEVLGKPKPYYLFPAESGAKRSETRMVPPGERALIRFSIPTEDLLAPLQAVAWTWLHLGTIGRRARRGYGSVLWEPQPGDLLEGFLEDGFEPGRDLRDRTAVERYLEKGLTRAWSAVGATPSPRRSSRPQGADYVLQSLDQVFVGEPITSHRWWPTDELASHQEVDATRSFEHLLHGMDEGSRGGEAERLQLGLARPRLPSPMLWRLLPCSSGGFVPVMTWSPVGYKAGVDPKITPGVELHTHLTERLGFERSLAKQAL